MFSPPLSATSRSSLPGNHTMPADRCRRRVEHLPRLPKLQPDRKGPTEYGLHGLPEIPGLGAGGGGLLPTKQTVASWKALSPLGDPNTLCKPSSARVALVGDRHGHYYIWIDEEGEYTVMWKSLRKLKLTNLIICLYRVTQTVLGAKATSMELELDSIYLNMSCQYVDWGTGVLTCWRSAYRTGTVPFRFLSSTARNLGYIRHTGVPDIHRISLVIFDRRMLGSR
ncbi:hypothetical protein HOY80DRAFT_546850 [Tuber brumale]|nr:hypothetical protein HOY80DRAFT_546850 [Tuber brumale]